MRRVWQVLLALVVLIAIGLIAVVSIPLTGPIDRKAIAAVKGLTGAELEIKGRTSLHFRPFLMVRFSDVTLHNPPAAGPGKLLQAETVDLAPSVSFSPWLWPEFGPGNLRVIAPRLSLTVDAQGRANWEALGAGASVPGTVPSGGTASGEKLMLGQVVLTNGTVSYADARSGQSLIVGDLEARIVQPGPDAPVDATFAGQLAKERIEGTARLPSLNEMARSTATRAIVTLSAAPGRADIDAVIDRAKGPSLAGRGKIDVPSLTTLAQWLELDPASIGSGPLSMSGEIAVAPSTAQSAPRPATETPVATVPADGWQVAVRNATLTVAGTTDKPAIRLDRIDASTRLGAATGPLTIATDATWKGERVEILATLQSPDAIARRAKSALTARIASKHGQLEISGDLHPGQAATFLGRAKAASPSLRDLAEQAGYEAMLPSDDGFEAVEVEGELSASAGKLRLWNARFKVDESTARGNLALDTKGPRTVVGGKLAVDRLDAARYWPGLAAVAPDIRSSTSGASQTSGSPVQPGSRSDGAPARDPFAVLEFVPLTQTLRTEISRLERGGAAHEAVTEAPAAVDSTWSDSPLDLAALKAVDLDLDLSVDELKVGRRALSVPRLKAFLAEGRLLLDGKDIGTHGGKVSGTAEVDVRTAVPAIKSSLKADGVEVEQLFTDFGLSPYLAGKAVVAADLTASGRSQRALVASLSGSAKATADNSAIVGWDLGSSWQSMFDSLRRGVGLQPWNGGARTTINQLGADIRIDKGVIEATAAQARGPQFAAFAEGRARLLTRQAEYRGTFESLVIPKLACPFRASGSWTSARPGIDPERGGMVRCLLSLIGFGRSSSGASLESVGADTSELEDLARTYVSKLDGTGGLSAEEAAQARQLKELLGPGGR